MKLAPIALFVYNRPIHARKTIESLQQNQLAQESDLYIFSDAPKKPDAAEAVNEVRHYLKTLSGFKSIHISEREENWGLARSIIDGVSRLCLEHGSVIVLEDDLLTAPSFLEYMNTALARYANEEQVMQISGYMFPVNVAATTDALFLPMTASWGWATWQRAWQHLDTSAQGYSLLKQDASLRHQFNLDGAYDYFNMLEMQFAGQVNSWAIRWYLSVFLKHGLVLFPASSLVQNIGHDGSGSHGSALHYSVSPKQDFKVATFPEIQLNALTMQRVREFHAMHQTHRPMDRLFKRLKQTFNGLLNNTRN